MSNDRVAVTPIVPKEIQVLRLEAANTVYAIDEGLKKKAKDPLFTLGRQRQLGEFRPSINSGHLVKAELEYSEKALCTIEFADGTDSQIDPTRSGSAPTEMLVEEELETTQNRPKAWNPRTLEYDFVLKNGDTSLSAKAYDGTKLDWYHFNLRNIGAIDEVHVSWSAMPAEIDFKGKLPDRWWSCDDANYNLSALKRPYLNFLSTTLLEYSCLFSGGDSFIIPIEQRVGYIRKIDSFKVIDSFGIVTDVGPTLDGSPEKAGFELFSIDDELVGKPTDGSIFFLPNTLKDSLQSNPIEEIRLFRDVANYVWAVEHKYTDEEGHTVNRSDAERLGSDAEETSSLVPMYWNRLEQRMVTSSSIEGEGEPGNIFIGPLEVYLPKSYVPLNWIPYRPMRLNRSGDYILRRSRTQEDITKLPQYKGLILSESKYLNEEGIPRIGLKLSRVYQLARDLNGDICLWRSRVKTADVKKSFSGLVFDSIVRPF